MPKFSVYAVIDATKYVGEFEADSKEEVEELAWDNVNHNISLCHHCSEKMDVGDIVKLIVEEIKE